MIPTISEKDNHLGAFEVDVSHQLNLTTSLIGISLVDGLEQGQRSHQLSCEVEWTNQGVDPQADRLFRVPDEVKGIVQVDGDRPWFFVQRYELGALGRAPDVGKGRVWPALQVVVSSEGQSPEGAFDRIRPLAGRKRHNTEFVILQDILIALVARGKFGGFRHGRVPTSSCTCGKWRFQSGVESEELQASEGSVFWCGGIPEVFAQASGHGMEYQCPLHSPAVMPGGLMLVPIIAAHVSALEKS